MHGGGKSMKSLCVMIAALLGLVMTSCTREDEKIRKEIEQIAEA
jgi:hypothetical protein